MPPPVSHDRRIHPGSGRRRGPDYPKGRQVDPSALSEVQAVLGDRERRRDLLIEHLHLLQDHFGCLHARHLAALAEEMRLALVEVYEVASFYAHFDIVMDGEAPPPPLTVRVCDSLSCELAGAGQLLADLKSRLGDEVRVVRAPCMGGCDRAPVVAIGHALHEHATTASVAAAVAGGATHPTVPEFVGLDAYRAAGGYRLLGCVPGRRAPARGGDRDPRAFRPARAWRRGVSRPGASGAWCARSRHPGCWRSTPTRASPAPSRTAIFSRPTRTA